MSFETSGLTIYNLNMPKITRINKAGYVHFHRLNNSSNELFTNFINEFSIEFFKYIGKYSRKQIEFHQKLDYFVDCLFWYGERQLTAAYFHAFHNMDVLCISEIPIKRFNSKIKSEVNGRIDYWCLYKKKDFYIESKHSNIRYKKALKLNSYINNQHKSDLEKLKNSVDNINKDKVSNSKAQLVLIHTMSMKFSAKEYYEYKNDDSNDFMNHIISDIKQSDTISFDHLVCFELNNTITDKVKYSTNDKEYYFPLMFIGFKLLN